MLRQRMRYALAGALMSVGGSLALAATSSAATPTPPFTQCPAIGQDTSGCELLFYYDSTGAVTVLADPSEGPFDGDDDTLIGVENGSPVSIGSIDVSEPGQDPFGFDGDGICSGDYIGTPVGCPFGPTGYEGPGVSYTNISADDSSGTVTFTPAIPPGGTAYFSLETAATASSITVAPPPHVTLTTPGFDAVYTVGQNVKASYMCTPGAGATLATCTGTQPDNSVIDTSTAHSGSFTVTATDTDGQAVSVTHSYTVNKAATQLTANPLVISAIPGLSLPLGKASAKLTAGSGHQPLADETVAFSAGGRTLCTGKTDASGAASCQFSVTGILASVLSGLKYQAAFAGDANYLASSATGPVALLLGISL